MSTERNGIREHVQSFVKKNAKTGMQFLRYGLLSGVALVCDVGLLYLLHEIYAVQYVLAASLSFSAGMIVVYLGSIAWVFDVRSQENRVSEIGIFVTIGIAGLFLNGLLIAFFVEMLHFAVLVAKGCTALFVFTFNFGMRKFFLFTQSKKATVRGVEVSVGHGAHEVL